MENTQIRNPIPSTKARILIIGGIVVLLILSAVVFWYLRQPEPPQSLTNGQFGVAAITNAFGANLKMVSLTAEPGLIASSMDSYYKPYVTPQLLAKWKANPTIAPGKRTSSPYPEKIEITSVTQLSKKQYEVVGTVAEVVTGSNGALTPVETYTLKLKLKYDDGIWLISDVQKIDQE
jgi:hypothetical protein